MIKRICDRCGEEIKDNYWTIDIYEQEDKQRKLSLEGAANNIKTNMDKIAGCNKEYCKSCIREIKDVISRKLNNEESEVKDE